MLKKMFAFVWIFVVDLLILLAVFSTSSRIALYGFDMSDGGAFGIGMLFAIMAFGHLKFRHKINTLRTLVGKKFSGLYGIWVIDQRWGVENCDDVVGTKEEMSLLIKEWKNELTSEQARAITYEVRPYE